MQNCDCVTVEVNAFGRRIQITGVYRSPSSNISNPGKFVQADIPSILKNLDRRADCLIVGDMNMCLLKQDSNSELYLDGCADAGFLSMNDVTPTRITDASASLIDHVLHRYRYGSDFYLKVSDFRAVSDHSLLEFGFKFENCPSEVVKCSRRRIDWERLRRRVEGEDWEKANHIASIESKSEELVTNFQAMLTECSMPPETRAKFRPVREWVTPALG